VGASVSSTLFSFGKDESKTFSKQYAAIYFTRLTALKQTVLDVAAAALPRFAHLTGGASAAAPKLCTRILDMTADSYCVLAGTLYKDMKLKPSILEEYSKTAGHASTTTADGQRYMAPDDTLVLEDEFGRVQLTGTAEALPVAALVSGLVVSVLGREVAGGKFEVVALFVPELAPQKALPAPLAAKESRPPAYMLCVSGLSMGLPGADATPVQLLMDYVTGLLGSTAEQRNSASIVRVLVAGNSLHRFEKRKSGKEGFHAREEADNDEAAAPLRELDVLLTQLAAAVPVDILPGADDPSNFTLPQQPFHKCLFPSASTYSTFGCTTNPAWMRIDGLETLVTSGQNVADLEKYCEAPAPIDVRPTTCAHTARMHRRTPVPFRSRLCTFAHACFCRRFTCICSCPPSSWRTVCDGATLHRRRPIRWVSEWEQRTAGIADAALLQPRPPPRRFRSAIPAIH